MLGFTVPSDVLDEVHVNDSAMKTQTHRFAWSLVEALRANGAEVRLVSVAPASDFPRNRRVWWPRRRFVAGPVEGVMLPFINLTGIKHVTRYLSCWALGYRELDRNRPDWILVHGVHSPFLWFAVSAARRLGSRVVVVMTDPPSVIGESDGGLVTRLKGIDRRLIGTALTRVHALVVLAEPLATDFAPGVPFLVVEGLFDPSANGQAPDRRPTSVRAVVFAGGLREEYGVANLVVAFRALRESDLELELYGRGPLEAWLREQADQDPRISAPRLVPASELAGIYSRATVLVQPRQVDQSFVPYSFPSKLIEYLSSGTVVVSTRLPTIPADYEPHVVWTADDSPQALSEAMARVLGWPQEQRATFGAEASSFVRRSRDVASQGARIVDFLLANARD